MKNCKIYVNGKSKEIQKKLFELGCKWLLSGYEIINANTPFLLVSNNSITCTDSMSRFFDCVHPEVTADEILSMKPEPKFKPFDRVLVRNSDNEVWKNSFYSYENYEKHFTLTGMFKYCLPFEGNEHLLGTTNTPE